jgi:two-component system response regulator HydG
MNTVLVVDDKELLRDSVGQTLTRAGFNVVTAADAASAVELIARRRPDAVVTDLKMPGPGGGGLELIEQARQIDDAVPFVVMTAFGTVETAVKAIKIGAFDYITKPFEGDELIIAVKRAIEHARLVRENAVLRTAADGGTAATTASGGAGSTRGLDRIIGDSPVIRRVKQQVMAVGESHGTVLICGESGTGKEVVARAIHDISPRAAEPFLAFNCAALSESLLESELFGHEKGAFTGAERLRKGRFELADRGTLLLDEISEISSSTQAKLLRVLQERTFERVGSSLSIGIDVRVVATSNRDLPKSVAKGEFRQDLFFRLNVLPIHLPPLRDRVEDVQALAEHFLRLTAQREGKAVKAIAPDAILAMQHYGWPGNVRELQNVCERAAVLCKSDTIERSLVEPWLMPMDGFGVATATVMNGFHGHNGTGNGVTAPLGTSFVERKPGPDVGFVAVDGRALDDIERDAIVRTLNRFNGHRQRTAQSLGIGVRTLGLKLKKWKELQLVEPTL